MAGTDYIETLPEDLVQILRDTGDEAAEYARGVLEEEKKEILEEFESVGVQIHEVDTEAFKERAQDVYEDFPEWTPGLYDEIQELLEDR